MTNPFDETIDRSAREMLDVEPRADLAARVVAQLPDARSRRAASGFRLPASGWVLSSIAAAAIVVLAVFVAPRESAMPQNPIVSHRSDQHLAAETTVAKAVAGVTAATPVTGKERVPPVAARTAARVVAATVDEDRHFTAIVALPGPSSIDVAGLEAPVTSALPSFAPEPMSIRALDVSALPETPRERREE